MIIEIVDLPIENGGSFHSYVNVYQRVLASYRSIAVVYGHFSGENDYITSMCGDLVGSCRIDHVKPWKYPVAHD